MEINSLALRRADGEPSRTSTVKNRTMNLSRLAALGCVSLVAAVSSAPVSAATKAFPNATPAIAPTFSEDAALAAAVAGPQRAAANRARDGVRKPVEALTFWGLQPGDVVIDLQPGGGYWTEILAPYAKATGGRYVAGLADLDNPKLSESARTGRANFLAKYADASVWGKVEATNFGGVSGALAPAGSVDLILTAREIHNWIPGGYLDKAMADIAAALKPGGVLAVEDHRADPRPMRPDASDGYVNEQAVIAAAEKAGLKLDARSELYANPKDSKDHPFGVWTLPPTRASAPSGQPENPAFNHAKYDAIGESDRMTLRFRKPG